MGRYVKDLAVMDIAADRLTKSRRLEVTCLFSNESE